MLKQSIMLFIVSVITLLRITVVAVALCAIVGLNNAYAGEMLFANMIPVASKAAGTKVSYPDVCMTPPSPGDPVPIPYPNTVNPSASAFKTGTKATKAGEKIYVTEAWIKTRTGVELAYKVTVKDRAGRNITLDRSKLFELTDGTFCAICVRDGLLTTILQLKALQQK